MENGSFLNKDYFEKLLEEIRKIRLIEKILSKNHRYICNQCRHGKIIESDVVIAKNYLTKEEIKDLERIVNAFLELAERRAERHIPMTMEDWSTRIDKYLLADDLDVLKDAKKISHDIAVDKALSEFEKYRIIQDKLFESDFDKFLNDIENNR